MLFTPRTGKEGSAMKQRILILCSGNSCRSQMAEAFLQAIDPKLQVTSAGTNPGKTVNPYAVKVMKEVGIDISRRQPKSVDLFLNDPFDYVITVCDNARETCPVFSGKVKNKLHLGFPDPAEATGTEEEILSEFRRIRDAIQASFRQFYLQSLKKE